MHLDSPVNVPLPPPLEWNPATLQSSNLLEQSTDAPTWRQVNSAFLLDIERYENDMTLGCSQLVNGQHTLPVSGCLTSCCPQIFGRGQEDETIVPQSEPNLPHGPGQDENAAPAQQPQPIVTFTTENTPQVEERSYVAILGGGNVGQTLVADLKLNTQLHPVLLFSGDGTGADRIGPSIGTVTFNETLHGSTHTVQLGPEHFGYLNTPSGVDVLKNAKIIVVTVPDAPLSRLGLYSDFQQKGLVEDPEKTFVLIRAGQAGQPALSQIIRGNPNWNASVVLVEDSPYGTRYVQTPSGPEITGKRKDSVEISVLGPDGDVTRGLTAMRDMFPLGAQINKPSWPDFTVVPGSDMPWRFGYAIHPRVAFDTVNLQMTINGQKYLHYVEGVNQQVGQVLGELDAERVQLAAAYGSHSETFPEKLDRQFGLTLNPGESFYETMQRTGPIYRSTSYGSVADLLKSRYPQEDVPGLFTMNWFAHKAGLHLPAHAEYEVYIRQKLSELGMSDEEVHTKLEGYMPYLNQIQGGVTEIKQLLDAPHVRH